MRHGFIGLFGLTFFWAGLLGCPRDPGGNPTDAALAPAADAGNLVVDAGGGVVSTDAGATPDAAARADAGAAQDAGTAALDAGGQPGDAGDPMGCLSTQALFNVVLGRPSDASVAISVLAEPGTELFYEYGLRCGALSQQTAPETSDGSPLVTEVTGLQANTRYVYRLRYRLPGQTEFLADGEHTFHTQRAAGSTFSFGLQGDSHPERAGTMFSAELYRLNMQNAAAFQPDFYLALGDDFSMERLLDTNTLSQDNVNLIYLNQRNYLGILGHSSAVFLVNGNHEQAVGYLLTDAYQTPYDEGPIYAGRARLNSYALPAPGGIYTGDTEEVPGVGLLRDYYAWEWGDALFVTLDPYWHSPVPVDNGVPGVDRPANAWDATMGDAQYEWFKRTLEGSHARFKFVFAHHVLGSGRGGAAEAHLYEWGGYDKNGRTYSFPTRRPTWAKPIHQLMNDNHVTIFFFGHDHVYAREKVDTVIYQSVQNPADNTYTAFNADAYDPDTIPFPGAAYDPEYGVIKPNSGCLQVTVSPAEVTVSYVRAVVPGDESLAGASNGDVAFSYSVPAN